MNPDTILTEWQDLTQKIPLTEIPLVLVTVTWDENQPQGPAHFTTWMTDHWSPQARAATMHAIRKALRTAELQLFGQTKIPQKGEKA